MQNIKTAADLKLAIQQLEQKQAAEWLQVKEAINNTAIAIRPINLIKNVLKDAVSSPDLKVDVFNAAIGLTTGILAKKLVIGKTLNPIKFLLGIVLEMVVANKVVKNADDIKSTGSNIFNRLFSKKKISTIEP